MFKFNEANYVGISDGKLVIKYKYESEEEIIAEKGEQVDLQDFCRKQEAYILPVRLATIELSKNWEERHDRYLEHCNKTSN